MTIDIKREVIKTEVIKSGFTYGYARKEDGWRSSGLVQVLDEHHKKIKLPFEIIKKTIRYTEMNGSFLFTGEEIEILVDGKPVYRPSKKRKSIEIIIEEI